ncbi:deoxyribonuclease IV [Mycoplasma todarodis]|uniref:Probable endonuclease 4 n=1 Tax=Mycoplasma todarodis TaxID=1937191 RepID=A0A4R0XVA0_9MOLU|nr:deoxyribonuclease IV [Mycoplasma todarodis]TCG10841.1 deoxyribonuclease IV [Mycoplasma todarodis]
MIKIGAHVSFSKKGNYLIGAGESAKKMGANAMMIYLGAPQNTRRADISEYGLEEYMEKFSEVVKPKDIVVHEPYIINPSSLDKAEFAEKMLIADAERMNYIGANIMVVHPGASTKFDRQESIERLVLTVKNVLKNTKDVDICLETMAGKGTEVGKTFEELSYVIKQVNSERVGICLDTCHAWDAGYNLKDLKSVINELKENDLLDRVKVLHINDSKNPISAHKDRHENIGKGFIGLETLREIVNAPEFEGVPMILETDGKDIYDKEIKMLISV